MSSSSLSRRNFLEITALGPAVVPRAVRAGHRDAKPPRAAAERPLRLDTGPETRVLFLDLREVEELVDLEQVVNPGRKHPANPVLSPRPGKWDATRSKYPCVLYDREERVFKMWYSGSHDTPELMQKQEGGPRHIGYATSPDGTHWDRRDLGLVEHEGSRANNLIIRYGQVPFVLHHPRAADPSRRWECYYQPEARVADARGRLRREGVVNHAWSPDGKVWTHDAPRPLVPHPPGPSNYEPLTYVYDAAEPDPEMRWKLYCLFHWMRQPGLSRGRTIGLMHSPDGRRWTPYAANPILDAEDGLETELHNAAVTLYHGCFVMLYDYVHPHHSMDIELATSRDGIRFRRVQNGRKVVELGRRGDFDAGMVIVSPMAFLVHDDRIWFYYTATPDTFQEGPRSGANRPWHRYTGLVNWRLDGLTHVQVAPGAQSGSLLTAPFQVRDRGAAELWINAAVGDRASALTAELVDAETRHPLEGYTRAESERFQSDSTGHALRWRRSPTLGGVRVPRIRVRFHLAGRDVRLHAFGFRPAR